MRKLQKDARQSENGKKQKEPVRVPFEPIPLHVPLNAPESESRPVERREESISSPRGVVIIDYGE